MRHYPVIIIGGGVTGIGILRDLSMRGIKALLLEQRDLANGTSSRFHGLLHSGARYAVGDPSAGKECIQENLILKKIAPYSIEYTEGFFIRTPEDPADYEDKWVSACVAAGIDVKQISVEEARSLEPKLSKDILSVYRVPDSAIDGFRLVWQNACSAARYGGEVQTYAKVAGITTNSGKITGVTIENGVTGAREEISCDLVVSAAGSWAGQVAHLAGLDVNVKPDRGLLLAFNHRFADRVINRLHTSSDADILVPHGSISILGTTSVSVDDPADNNILSKEAIAMLDIGEKLFPDIKTYRILRAFAGTRPLYTPGGNAAGRKATRNFVVIDHAEEGLDNLITVVGGKFTTYRLMAEKASDVVAARFGNTEKCRTADEAIVEPVSESLLTRAKKYFPVMGVDLSVARQGDDFEKVVERLEADPSKKVLLCECELVTQAEFEEIANRPTSQRIGDIRRRTRMGMGTCQGTFCGYRSIGAIVSAGVMENAEPHVLLKQFVEERWHGIRATLWGTQIQEAELSRGIYGMLLNVDGVEYA
jgi:glycerol-3-phosphate dehydrogenase